jgi:tetratricopeptide (TPR) repeat protein
MNERAYYRAIRGVQLAAALTDINAALKKKRADHFYATRGLIYLEIGQFDAAIKDLERAQFGPPETAGRVAHHLELANIALGNQANAQMWHNRATSLNYKETYERVLLSTLRRKGNQNLPPPTTDPSQPVPVIPISDIPGLQRYELGTIGLSAAFEGIAWTTALGNVDGFGITFGVGQWNMRSDDGLPQLLREMRSEDQSRFDVIAGDGLSDLLSLMASDIPIARRLERANSPVFQGDTAGSLNAVWQQRFAALGSEPKFIAVQARRAKRVWLPKATELANKFGLHSERGIALVYDILIQGMRSSLEQKIMAKSSDPALTSETDRMVAIANAVADSVPDKNRDLTRARKMIIATGRGEFRRATYDLDALGITLNPPAASAPTP